jgi:hypothetical protein
MLSVVPNIFTNRPRAVKMDFAGEIIACHGDIGFELGGRVFGWVPSGMHNRLTLIDSNWCDVDSGERTDWDRRRTLRIRSG